MLTVASDAHRAHHPRTPFLDRGQLIAPPEVPERAERIVAALVKVGMTPIAPELCDDGVITRVHSDEYVAFLRVAHERWRAATGLGASSEAVAYARPMRGDGRDGRRHVIADLGWYSHDSDPVLAGTWSAARAAVDVTMTAWRAVADGRERHAYALARPPGHHAGRDSFAGYCYLNNAAIAAQAWCDRGARVAVVDVDYHHGNGTQHIFYDRDDVLFVSLHADPADEYPFHSGFASENRPTTHNFPLPAGTTWDAYGPALEAALRAVRDFAPDGIVVSLGVDTAAEDPDRFELVADDYGRMGAQLAALDRPTVIVQEGGYCLDVIGRNVARVLSEF
ncbi:MAG TPA: histone deacetylase family protein [Acidimicrobiia bacterium]|nr:histone deacetylase family protein [Acidimicrobiia bacterium]